MEKIILAALIALTLTGCYDAHGAPAIQADPHRGLGGDAGVETCQTCHTYDRGRLEFPEIGSDAG